MIFSNDENLYFSSLLLLSISMKNIVFLQKDNNYVVYNIERHVSVLVDYVGYLLIQLFLQSKEDIDDFGNYLPESIKQNAFDFINRLKKIGLFYNGICKEINIVNNIPNQYYLHLTYKCNLKCKYCYNKDIRNYFSELSMNKWEKIISSISPFAKNVIITGGEPFLFKNIDRVVDMLKSANMSVIIEIISNGMIEFSSYKFNRLFDRIDKITFSCDSFVDSNQLRVGFKVDNLFHNIQWLKVKNNKLKIAISSTYFKNGFLNQKIIENYCKNNNIDFRSVLIVPNNICELKYLPTINEYKNAILNKSKDITMKRVHCGAAVGLFSIAPNGDVFPCQNLHYDEFKIGNILNSSLNDLINSSMAIYFREKLKVYNIKKCKSCSMRFICGGGCRAATYRLEHDISEHPKHLCKFYKDESINDLYNYNRFDLETIMENSDKINNILINQLKNIKIK